MVNRFGTVWGRYFPPSDTFIICTAIFLCCLLLVPNGQEPRVQRFGNMHLAALLCVGLYVMRFNGWAGSLLAYSAGFMACTVSEMPIITVMLIFGVFFGFIVSCKYNQGLAYGLLCCIALLNVAWQILQFFGVFLINVPLGDVNAKLYVGLMANTNETATLLAICLPFFFRRKWWLFIPVVVLGLCLAKGRGGIIAATVVSAFYILMNLDRRRRVYLLLACVAALFVFFGFVRSLTGEGPSLRLPAYAAALDTYAYNPAGWGIGQFKSVFPLVASFNQLKQSDAVLLIKQVHDKKALARLLEDKRARDRNFFKKDRVQQVFTEFHNEYGEWAFNAGIQGFALLVGGLALSLCRGYSTGSLSFYGLLASCLSALWFFPWHIIPTAAMTVFFLGDIDNQWRRENKNES